MNKIGVIKYNVSGLSIEEFFSWCAENGVGYTEIRLSDVWKDTSTKENNVQLLSGLIQKYGVKISQISADNDFIRPTEEEFEKEVFIVQELCKMVKDLGFNQLRMDGGRPKDTVDETKYKDMVLDGLKRSVEIAEREKVYMALDNHGKVTNNYQFQLELFKKIDSKYFGANIDTMNYRAYGYPVEELIPIYKEIAPYVLHTHMKDGIRREEDSRYIPKVFGEGEIPLLETIEILKNVGYQGVWCVEYEGKDGIEGYKKCVEWLKREL
jgi:sugar phosphate isomerase/epimerase